MTCHSARMTATAVEFVFVGSASAKTVGMVTHAKSSDVQMIVLVLDIAFKANADASLDSVGKTAQKFVQVARHSL